MRVRLWGAPGGSSDGTLLPSFGAGPSFVQISQLFVPVTRSEEVAGVVGQGVAPLSLSGGPTGDAAGAARGCVCALCAAGSSCRGGRVPVPALCLAPSCPHARCLRWNCAKPGRTRRHPGRIYRREVAKPRGMRAGWPLGSFPSRFGSGHGRGSQGRPVPHSIGARCPPTWGRVP